MTLATTCRKRATRHVSDAFTRICPHNARLRQDFPYNVEAGIEHHNLWSSKPLSPERLQQACRRIALLSKLPPEPTSHTLH